MMYNNNIYLLLYKRVYNDNKHFSHTRKCISYYMRRCIMRNKYCHYTRRCITKMFVAII